MAIIQVLETFAGSPFLYQESTASAAFGIDVSSGDAVKLVTLATAGAVVSGTAQFTVNTTTNGNIQFAPNGTGDLELVNGSFLVDAGNIYVPTTSSTEGVYYVNSVDFMHSYGTQNTFLGAGAGNFSLTSSDHVGIGTASLASLTGGGAGPNSNTAVGWHALTACTASGGNTAIGAGTLIALTIGNGVDTGENVAIGWNTGAALTGSGNTLLGAGAMGVASGAASYNIVIGDGSGNNYTTNESSNILIANAGVVSESHVMRLGTTGSTANTLQVNTTFIAGIYNVNAGSIANVATVASTGQFGTAVITAGAGIVVTAAANTITIAGTGAGFTWHDVTGGSATMAAENGYIADSGSLTTLTLPANNAFGDTIKVVGKGAGGWKIVYTTGQNIIFGSSASTATTGDISSTNANDCVELICTTASSSAPIFTVVSSVGNITVV